MSSATQIRIDSAAYEAVLRQFYRPYVETTAISFELELHRSRSFNGESPWPWRLETGGDLMKYTVIGSHRPESSDFFSTCVGDELSVERKQTTYPGWIWCTDHGGAQAWVPKAYVSFEGARCFMTREYISRELEVEVGDKVELLEIESGWAWVLDGNHVNGWIPMECLEPVEPNDVSG